MPVLTARISEDIHRRVKARLAASGRSFQELIENAVRAEDDDEPAPAPSRAKVSAGDKWVRLLRQVLESEFAPALQENLKAFSRAARDAAELRRIRSGKDAVEDRARLEDPIEEIERATLAAVKRAERAIKNDSTGESQTVRNRKKIG